MDRPSQPGERPKLHRSLSLLDLVLYGLVLIQPIAPVGIFGIAEISSRGHVSLTILLAMVAMMLTARSYGLMAVLYPAAGSAYVYVGKAFGPHFGFIAGWVMFLDYLIIPIINIIYLSLTMQRLLPGIPYWIWAALAASIITLLNLRNIGFTARANQLLMAVMGMVVGAFVLMSLKYVFGAFSWRGIFSTTPFYNPTTFSVRAIATATSLAALTYIGFDGVTTLAEEVAEPKRTVPLATVLVCLITGLLSTLEVYLAQRVWPDYTTFHVPETAFLDVCLRAGGALLFQAMAAVLVIASLGSGLAAQAGLARLLYGMGREGVIPKSIFSHLNERSAVPVYNIVIVGVAGFLGALALSYERTAELVNFGAFLAFMGVNLATIKTYYFTGVARRFWSGLLLPAAGLMFCLFIWLGLPKAAKIVGGLWLIAGLLYQGARTRGFRSTPPALDPSTVSTA